MHQTPERGRGLKRQVQHRYSNSSSKYFSEYSISWAVIMLRARGVGYMHGVGCIHGSRERARVVRAACRGAVCVSRTGRGASRESAGTVSWLFLTRVSLDGSVSARQCYGNGLRELIFFTESSTAVE